MPATPSVKYAIPRPADADFVSAWPAMSRSIVDLIDSLMATVLTTTPRPAAATFGRIHLAADGTTSFDTGTAWVEIARHPHASKHAVGGSDPLTVVAAMLDPDVPLPNVGDLAATARTTLPANGKWAWADGSLIDRTTYAAFFAAVGHAYNGGVDPGGNTVRVPDLRGRVPVGVDGAAGRLDALDALGQAGGEQKHTLAATEMPSHQHQSVSGRNVVSVPTGNTVSCFNNAGGTSGTEFGDLQSSPTTGTNDLASFNSTAATGGGTAHNVMQPYQVVNYLVRIA